MPTTQDEMILSVVRFVSHSFGKRQTVFNYTASPSGLVISLALHEILCKPEHKRKREISSNLCRFMDGKQEDIVSIRICIHHETGTIMKKKCANCLHVKQKKNCVQNRTSVFRLLLYFFCAICRSLHRLNTFRMIRIIALLE